MVRAKVTPWLSPRSEIFGVRLLDLILVLRFLLLLLWSSRRSRSSWKTLSESESGRDAANDTFLATLSPPCKKEKALSENNMRKHFIGTHVVLLLTIAAAADRAEPVWGVEGEVRDVVLGPVGPLGVEQLDGLGLVGLAAVLAAGEALDVVLNLLPAVVNAGTLTWERKIGIVDKIRKCKLNGLIGGSDGISK